MFGVKQYFNPIVTLGIGNRLMMDDGIGVLLVERLQKQKWQVDIKFAVGETDIDYCMDICLEAAKEKALIVVIDAVILGRTPGELSIHS